MGSYFHAVAHCSKRLCDYFHDKRIEVSPIAKDYIENVEIYFSNEVKVLKKIRSGEINFENVPKTEGLAKLLIDVNEKGDLDESQVGFIMDRYSHIVKNLHGLRGDKGIKGDGKIYTPEEDFKKTYEFMRRAKDFFETEFKKEVGCLDKDE